MDAPAAPFTVEGFWVLHQVFRLDRPRWSAQPESTRRTRAAESAAALTAWAASEGGSAPVAVLGHKGDLLLVHFRRDTEALARIQGDVAAWALAPFLVPTGSYVSVVEQSLYDLTGPIAERLRARGLAPGAGGYHEALAAELDEQRRRMAPRLLTPVPRRRFAGFYPMSRRRGEERNWYALPLAERARQTHEHGKVGRRYAGRLNQVISGSIGYESWEWGVDLFADDPVVFKRVITEMRYDEVSAHYAEFGPFLVGLQFSPAEMPSWLEGRVPALLAG